MKMESEKTFKYKGKTLDELKAMSHEDIAAIFPSDVRRKMTRGFTTQEQIFLKNIEAGVKNLKTHCRDMIVLPNMVGLKIGIYSGKEFVVVSIVEAMIAMRFGELVPTRKIATHTGGGAKKTVVRK